MRNIIVALVVLGLAPLAHGDASKLKPSGWSADKSSYSDRWEFTSPDGRSEASVIYFKKRDLSHLAEMNKRHMKPYGTEPTQMHGPETVTGGGIMYAGVFVDEGDGTVYMAMGLTAPHKSGGTLSCYMYGPALNAQPPAGLADYLDGCATFAANGEPYDADMAKQSRQREAVAAVQMKPGKNKPLEAVMLDLHYIGGVGGMVYPDYSPIYLFKDGTACACPELAASDADPSEWRKTHPDEVTTWTRSGGKYAMTWPGDDEPTEIESSGGLRAKTFGNDHRLNGYWQRTSGGGNTALGGDVMVVSSNGFRFYPDGSFSNDRFGGGSGPSVTAGSSSGKVGRYRIDGGTLSLTFADGEVRRTSLYYSDDEDVVWLGGDSFIKDD